MSKENEFDLVDAKKYADEIVDALKLYCDKIMVVGSIRRKKAVIHDIDIILIPVNMDMIRAVAMEFHPNDIFSTVDKPKWGEKMARFSFNGTIPVDLYFANDHTWPILKLIRTGSAEHNRFLCGLAKRLGMYLAADGSRMAKIIKEQFNTTEEPLRVESEEDIFYNLDLSYVEPEEREIHDVD